MGDILEGKERKLEGLRVDKEIAGEKSEIAEREAHEKEMRRQHGPNWRKILGMMKIRPNREAIQDLYTIDPALKDLSRPGGRRLR